MWNRALPYLLTASTLLLSTPALAAPPEEEGGWFEVHVETEGEDEAEAVDAAADPDDPAKADPEEPSADAPEKLPEAAAPSKPEAKVARDEPAAPSFPLPAGYYSGRKKYLKPIEGQDPPAGYVSAKRNYRGLWAGGVAIAAGTYAINLAFAAIASADYGDPDIVRFGSFPIVGPFIAAGDDRVGDGYRGAFLGMGIGHLIGFGMIIGGVSARIPTWKREATTGARSAAVDLDVSPGGAALNVSF
ncbi:MAG: hypothetical protein IPM79_27710 [Polyangiaceae bacterium]|jgi:hypothetical protein|nr:hypothetical protein [Polyangiaceae bacterium]MBK8941292.1 hypothetical protein [Polyangiaceae bacterium]